MVITFLALIKFSPTLARVLRFNQLGDASGISHRVRWISGCVFLVAIFRDNDAKYSQVKIFVLIFQKESEFTSNVFIIDIQC